MISRNATLIAYGALAVVAGVFGVKVFLFGGSQFQDPNDSPLYESTLKRAQANFKSSEIDLVKERPAPARTSPYQPGQYQPRGNQRPMAGQSADRTAPLLRLGLKEYQGENYEAAARYFETACKSDPTSRNAWLYLGMAYMKTGQEQKARSAYAEAAKLKSTPAHPQPQQRVQPGVSQPQEMRPQQGTPAEAVNAKPEDFIRLGMALYNQGKYKEAVQYFDSAIKLDPSNPQPYFSLGNCCLALGDTDKMLQYYQAATEAAPQDALVHYYLGVAYTQVDRKEDARQAYRKAIELDPKHTAAHEGLGQILQAEGKHEEAMKEFRYEIDLCKKLIEKNPERPLSYNRLAKFYVRNKINLEEGKQLIAKALELSPDNATFLSTAAQLEFAMGNRDKAIELIDQAIAKKTERAAYYKLLRKTFAAEEQKAPDEAAPVAGP